MINMLKKINVNGDPAETKELIEIKAKVDNLNIVREKLYDLGAVKVGIFRQIDTYFDVPEGRLKLRETEDSEILELVYYERENIPGPKRSKVYVLRFKKSNNIQDKLDKILKKTVIVDKIREIYLYKGTKIHLDNVRGLGMFVEFEKKVCNIERDKEFLRCLMKKLSLNEKHLESFSYSDLVST
ncbi:TPA: CYTH domain-containing protein [Candidatus Bathyarchaeota archaeon]|nr:CYTH domain-containing protein [Candidatus Bathyarchaeota archaeon]